jgi:hypothetical protein
LEGAKAMKTYIEKLRRGLYEWLDFRMEIIRTFDETASEDSRVFPVIGYELECEHRYWTRPSSLATKESLIGMTRFCDSCFLGWLHEGFGSRGMKMFNFWEKHIKVKDEIL